MTHAARFVLVGTMNPEEGDLRPQLLDRFGLTVEVAADRDPAARVQVVRRRLAYEADPRAFAADYADSDEALAGRLSDARDSVGSVDLPDSAVVSIASLCAAYDLDGLRGDLVVARCAVAHAAWCGRDVVSNDDIRVAARLALPHRRRRNPFDSTDSSARGLDDLLDEMVPATPPAPPEGPEPPASPDPEADGPVGGPAAEGETAPEEETPPGSSESSDSSGSSDGSPQRAPGRGNDTQGEPTGTPYAAHLLRLDRAGRGVVGRRSAAITTVGRHVRPVGLDDARGQGLSLMGTVLAAATRTAGSRPGGDAPTELGRIALSATDLRRSLRHGKEGNLVVFVVDTSGSMGAARRVREVKTAVVSLLLDAYQRRDKVAVLTFGDRSAQVVLPPTSSVELAERLLTRVATGGRTPLAEGIAAATDLVRRERARDPHRRALVLLMTDGRANAGPDALARALGAAAEASRRDGEWVVVDCEDGPVRLGLAAELGLRLGGVALRLDELSAQSLVSVVKAA